MQHYQVPSAKYSNNIKHDISLGLAGDYIAQLHGSCSPDSSPSLRAAMDKASRHLSGVVDDLGPVPVSAPGVPGTMEHLSQTQQLAWQQPCPTLLSPAVHLKN